MVCEFEIQIETLILEVFFFIYIYMADLSEFWSITCN